MNVITEKAVEQHNQNIRRECDECTPVNEINPDGSIRTHMRFGEVIKGEDRDPTKRRVPDGFAGHRTFSGLKWIRRVR